MNAVELIKSVPVGLLFIEKKNEIPINDLIPVS